MRKRISITLNILIVIFTCIGTYMMFHPTVNGVALATRGFRNFKFFTVLSNEFCGVVAILWLIYAILGKKFPVLVKLMAAAAVGLTFVIIAFFLAPMYPSLNLYEGGNFWFHLIVPLTGMVEFVLLKNDSKIPLKYATISAVLSFVYGIYYLGNILINGKGEWPDTNDWYGFLNWGYPVGIGIFAFVVLLNFAVACLLRWINNKVNSKS